MSYDVHLEDEQGKILELPYKHDLRGGIYAIGGTSLAELNITYNYSEFFRRYLDPEQGLRVLYGKKAKDCIPLLWKAINDIGTIVRSGDYWDANPGNVGAALNDLLQLARALPEGIFQGD